MDAPGWRPGEDPPSTPQAKSGRNRLIRPYAVTGGRTAPRMQLALEALVSSATFMSVDTATLSTEYQAIISLSQQVRSVAELSALLRMPLGVTRVLIADMAAEGLVQIHQPSLDAGKPDLNLLERVLSGLRRL
ncbi:DUF742 domain-containing protein [Streptosporangium saharense]|uniref:DUF742 domain-containing protein n=1 Tax=Streptosporangium saharense TaxID=1706840 RepID=UPI00162124E8|nr:DUF742 domain-containing protein [Streptosporangium saharense]